MGEPPVELKEVLARLQALESGHLRVAALVFERAKGNLFPCDALVLAGLDRSLNLLRGFGILLANGGYVAAAHLLRSELDTTLRLYAIIDAVDDPHGVASAILAGEHLTRIKDKDGKPLSDGRIVELVKGQNPSIRDIYEKCSGYVHFSQAHVLSFLRKAEVSLDGNMTFQMRADDDHVAPRDKIALCRLFEAMVLALFGLCTQWSEMRDQYGTLEVLSQRFGRVRLPPTPVK